MSGILNRRDLLWAGVGQAGLMSLGVTGAGATDAAGKGQGYRQLRCMVPIADRCDVAVCGEQISPAGVAAAKNANRQLTMAATKSKSACQA